MEEGEEKQKEEQNKNGLATYVCFGMLFGVAIGSAWHNVGLGLVLGIAIAYAYYQYKVKSDKKNNNNNELHKE